MMSKILDFLRLRLKETRRSLGKKITPDGKVSCSTDGFLVENLKGTCTTVNWAEVTRIVAFKRDLFAYDLLCLGFEIGSGKNLWNIEVTEETTGFDLLVAEMARAVPLVRKEWRAAVVEGPFQANEITLFEADSSKVRSKSEGL